MSDEMQQQRAPAPELLSILLDAQHRHRRYAVRHIRVGPGQYIEFATGMVGAREYTVRIPADLVEQVRDALSKFLEEP